MCTVPCVSRQEAMVLTWIWTLSLLDRYCGAQLVCTTWIIRHSLYVIVNCDVASLFLQVWLVVWLLQSWSNDWCCCSNSDCWQQWSQLWTKASCAAQDAVHLPQEPCSNNNTSRSWSGRYLQPTLYLMFCFKFMQIIKLIVYCIYGSYFQLYFICIHISCVCASYLTLVWDGSHLWFSHCLYVCKSAVIDPWFKTGLFRSFTLNGSLCLISVILKLSFIGNGF